MTTLTLTINEQSARTAQRIAQQRQTTVDVIVQELLTQLGHDELDTQHHAVEELERSFLEVSRPLERRVRKDRDEITCDPDVPSDDPFEHPFPVPAMRSKVALGSLPLPDRLELAADDQEELSP